MSEPQQEQVRRGSVDLSRPVTDLDDMWRLAQALAQSSVVPQALQGKPANVLVVLMTGMELGFTPGQSIRMVYVPSAGSPQLTGKALLIRLRHAGHTYDWKYSDDGDACTFTLTRRDEPDRAYTGSFSVEDAVTAGLARRDKEGHVVALSQNGRPLPWQQYRRDLLFWRAVANCVNKAAPEVTFGLDLAGAVTDDGGSRGPVDLSPAAIEAPGPDAGQVEELAAMDRKARESAPQPEGKPSGRRRAKSAQSPRGATPQEELRLALQSAGFDPGSVAALDLCSVVVRRHVTSLPEIPDHDAAGLAETARRAAAETEEPAIVLAELAEGWEREWEYEDPGSYGAWQQARARRPGS